MGAHRDDCFRLLIIDTITCSPPTLAAIDDVLKNERVKTFANAHPCTDHSNSNEPLVEKEEYYLS